MPATPAAVMAAPANRTLHRIFGRTAQQSAAPSSWWWCEMASSILCLIFSLDALLHLLRLRGDGVPDARLGFLLEGDQLLLDGRANGSADSSTVSSGTVSSGMLAALVSTGGKLLDSVSGLPEPPPDPVPDP